MDNKDELSKETEDIYTDDLEVEESETEESETEETEKESVRSIVNKTLRSYVNIETPAGTKIVTGEKIFVNEFNKISEQLFVESKADSNKPKFRLLPVQSGSIPNTEELEEIGDLQAELLELNYKVNIFEDIEIIDVTKEEKYIIIIENVKNHIQSSFSLIKFRNDILDFDFNPEEFIISKIEAIEGISNRSIEIADKILDILSYIIHYRIFYISRYQRIGWDRYNWGENERIFKYDEIYSNNPLIKGYISQSQLEGLELAPEYSSSNKEARWTDLIFKMLNRNNPLCSLLLGAGCTGMIRPVITWTKETNININIQGKPGSGKSTIGHVILSIFGKVDVLEGNSMDTTNANELARSQRPIVPFILDERMLAYLGESENKKKISVIYDIFREYTGRTKRRYSQNNENIDDKTYSPIISSSVDSMLDLATDQKDLGQYRRFIEFKIGGAEEQVLFDKELAEEAELISQDCYGYGVRYMAKYMLYRFSQNDNYFQNRFSELNNKVSEALAAKQDDKIKGLTSSSMRFSLIILSYQIFRESLLYKNYSEIEYKISESENNQLTSDEGLSAEEKDVVSKYAELILRYRKKIDKYGNLEDFLASGDYIPDRTEEIINLLIDNLIQKITHHNEIAINNSNLYDWIINPNNRKYFFESTGANNGWEGNEWDYIGKIIDSKDSIEISTIAKLNVHRLLCSSVIPEPETIIEYVKAVLTDDTEEKYKALSQDEIDLFEESNEDMKINHNKTNRVFSNNRIVKATIIKINKPGRIVNNLNRKGDEHENK